MKARITSHIIKSCAILIFFVLSAPVYSSQLPLATLPYNIDQTHYLNHFFEIAEVKEPIYLVLVDKVQQRLKVLEQNSHLRVVAEYPCATGENPGRKKISGDSRTPEGIYFITKIFKDKKITVFGNRAFHLDYPNIYDSLEERNGDGIYIHGTNKELEPYSTNGCITMKNEDLDQLVKYMGKYITPVVIVENIEQLTVKKSPNLSNMDYKQAKNMLIPGNLNPEKVEFDLLYLINYDTQTVAVGEYIYRQFENSRMRGYSRAYLNFSPTKGWITRKKIWHTAPLHLFPSNHVKVASYKPFEENVGFYEEQDLTNYSEILASAPVQEPSKIGTVPEYIDVAVTTDSSGDTIINEKSVNESSPAIALVNQPPVVQHIEQKRSIPKPMQVAVSEPEEKPVIPERREKYPKDKQEILHFIEDWRQAWESKEIDQYISSYNKLFRQGRKDLDAWRAHKERLNQKYSTINVEISDVTIRWTHSGATVLFHQVYQSDKFFAEGQKTLVLTYSDNRWTIQQELWSKGAS